MDRPELIGKGYKVVTPDDTGSPLLTFLVPRAKSVLTEPLAKVKVRINMLHDNHVRSRHRCTTTHAISSA